MALILNENIDSAMQRWQAWFDGTLDEGPLIYVESPLGFFREELRPMTLPDNAEKIWTDIDFRDAGSYNYMISSFFGGDAVPMYFVNLGPGSVASYLGSTPLFDNSTVWFGQLEDNRLEKVYEHLVYDPQNPYWVLTKEYTRRLLETANGEYHISIADLGGSLDILSSLRGAQNVLMDLIDQP
ncbi:MAG: hypothetical protein JW920_08015 [Deltaproteobacteria bacterium]|nr:hypothetical protein [Deltaproteobacteria bacterium]